MTSAARFSPCARAKQSRERGSQGHTEARRDRSHVLVAAPRDVDDDDRAVGQRRRDLGQRRDGVRALERAEDPLGARQQLEAGQRLVVGDRQVAARGRSPSGTRARARRRDSRARRRSSAPRRSGPRRRTARTSARRAARRRARAPASPRGGRCRCRRPPPRRRRARPSRRGRRRETGPWRWSRRPRRRRSASGSRPSASWICARASRPITACSSRTSSRIRVRAGRPSRSRSGWCARW